MNPPKCNDLDYIQFLIASQHAFTATEAPKPILMGRRSSARAYTRLLYRTQSDGRTLWQEVKPLVELQEGMLVLDDSTLDKPYAKQMDLVTYHWSGKHQAVVKGINLLSLLWTDGRRCFDFRIYNKKTDGLTKNDHFRAMVHEAQAARLRAGTGGFRQLVCQSAELEIAAPLAWSWSAACQKTVRLTPMDKAIARFSRFISPGMADKSISKDMAGSKYSRTKMATLNTGPPVTGR